MSSRQYSPLQKKEQERQAVQAGKNAKSMPSAQFSQNPATDAGSAIIQQMKVKPDPVALGVNNMQPVQMVMEKAIVHTKTNLLKDEGDGKAGTGLFTAYEQKDIGKESEIMADFDQKDGTGKYVKAEVVTKTGYIQADHIFKEEAFGFFGGDDGQEVDFETDDIGVTEQGFSPVTAGLDVNDKIAGAVERDHLKEVKGGKLQDKDGKSAKIEGRKNRMDVAAGVGGTISGVIGFAGSVKSFVDAEDNWAKFEAGAEMLENAIGTGSGIAKIIDASAKSGGSSDGVGKSDVTGKVFEAAGAAVSSVKDAVLGLHGIYQLVKGETDNSTQAGLAATKRLLTAAQSAATVAKQAYDIIGKGIPTGVLATIPALGIAINAIDIIIRFNDRLKASGSMDNMGSEADGLRPKVLDKLGGVSDDIMDKDKRGTFPVYQTFLRVKGPIKEVLGESLVRASANPSTAKVEVETYLSGRSDVADSVKNKIVEAADAGGVAGLTELNNTVLEYELADKLTEIAMKRKTSASTDIAADLVNIIADVVTLSGAGALAGAIMKGVVAAGKGAHAGSKFIQQAYRDNQETNKSTANKHKEYVRHAKFIFKMSQGLESFSDTTPEDEKPKIMDKAKKVQGYIKATGVSPTMLYAENGNPQKQASMIVEALKKRK